MPANLSDLLTFEIPGIIHLEEHSPGYPLIHVRNEHAEASIALHGAHLTHYARHGETPVIFTSKAAIYNEGKAIRGGIPVCWPWFGAHPDASKKLPAHGYARTSFWHLTQTSSDVHGTRLCFELPANADRPLAATLEIHIGKELKLQLSTHNPSQSEHLFSEALHSYFSVGNSQQTQVKGLDQTSYIDSTAADDPIIKQTGPVDFPGEIDRIYHSEGTVTINDHANQRRITVTKQNSASTIIWNPGEEKGRAMADLLDSEIQQFVCAESGNVRDQSISLAPDATHTLTLSISTQS